MNWNWQRGKSATLDVAASHHDRGKLRALIDQATGDSVDESDEHAGLLSMIREEVVCPFRARVAGEDVECVRFEWPKNGYGLNAVCKSEDQNTRGRHRCARMGRAASQGPRMDRGLLRLARPPGLTDPSRNLVGHDVRRAIGSREKLVGFGVAGERLGRGIEGRASGPTGSSDPSSATPLSFRCSSMRANVS